MNRDLAKSIGTAARQARKTLKLTQEDAAERINVSVEFYARLERGTSLPSIITFARLVSALGVSADLLLGKQASVVTAETTNASWSAAAPTEGPEVRRLMRRLRRATPSTLRLVSLMLREIESSPASNEQLPLEQLAIEHMSLDESEAAMHAVGRVPLPANEQSMPVTAAAAE